MKWTKSKEGFEGDEMEKAMEKWEEMERKHRESSLTNFFKKLKR